MTRNIPNDATIIDLCLDFELHDLMGEHLPVQFHYLAVTTTAATIATIIIHAASYF